MATTLASALRLVKPGETVVSVSEILDKIGDKLSPSEKQDLLVAILSRRTDRVRPGDLITSDLVNQILADVADLQVRVADLEQGGQAGETPAIGIIGVSHTGGTPSAVVGEAEPQDFKIQNGTDTALRIKATASMTAPTGDWARSALFENGSDTVVVNVPSGKDVSVKVFVTAPRSAVLGETATLTVNVDVGAPHNKHDDTSAELTVSLSPAPPLTHTLELGDPPEFPADFKNPPPPAGVDGQIPKGKVRTITYALKHDTQSPAEDPGFEFSVVLSEPAPSGVATLAKWVLLIDGAAADTDQTDEAKTTRTLKKKVTLDPGVQKHISLKLTAPNEDNRIKVAVTVSSTKLATVVEKAATPIVISTK